MTRLTCPHCGADLKPEEIRWRSTPVDELALSIRAINCLHNGGYQTVGDVADASDGELLREPNFGRRSLNDVREVIARLRETAR